MVGGVDYEVAGVGNFEEGFIAGAISGAMAGARNVDSSSSMIEAGNKKVTSSAFVQVCGAIAVGYLGILAFKFFFPHLFDKVKLNSTDPNWKPSGGPNSSQPAGQPAPNQSAPPASGSENSCVA